MYFLTFLILSVLSVITASHIDSTWQRIALFYAGFSFAMVGMAYLAQKPSWLLKRPSGSIRPIGWLLYWPYFLLNGLLFFLQRRLSREYATAQIIPGLFLGRMLTTFEASLVAPQPVAIIDMTAEFNETPRFRAIAGYRLLSVLDGTAPTLEQLQQGVTLIAEWLPKGRVYVHCALGHGRSATMIAAFLLAASMADSVEEAITMIRSERAGVGLKPEQVRILQEFERGLMPLNRP
jgi:hypothetical protein